MNKQNIAIAITILFLVSACTPNMTSLRISPNVNKILPAVSNMALLPGDVNVNTLDTFNNKKRMYNYEYHIEAIIKEKIAKEMRKRGYKVAIISRKEIGQKAQSRSIVDLKRQYNKKRSMLYLTHWMKKEQAFNINVNFKEKIRKIANMTSADLLLFVNYNSVVKTNGARAKDFAVDILLGTSNSNNADSAMLYLGLIDAKSGKWIWANATSDTKSIYSGAVDAFATANDIDNKRLDKMVLELLRPFPAKGRKIIFKKEE